MKKQDLVHSFVLLAILIVAVSGLFFFSKFTGYVTNVITGETIVSSDFSEGVLEGTKVNSNGYVVLLNAETLNGNYTSKIFGNGTEVAWNTFITNTELPSGTLVFYVRGCDDALCDAETFSEVTSQDLNFDSEYIQYKAEMTRTPEEGSPKIKEVNISYTIIPAETCSDGIQNQDEEGVDCGGTICSACVVEPTCSDTIQNQDETGVDCGGECAACATCSDTIQNQDETDIDCGGVCPACPVCGDGSCNGAETCTDCDDCACSSGYSCNSGVCEETGSSSDSSDSDSESTSEDESDVQVSVNAASEASAQTPVCAPNWQCDEWGACENGQRARACIDSNACGTTEGSPSTSEACQPTETCADGIQNQNEEGIDCGGPCETKCTRNIFTIIGSAVAGPFETGKTFFQKEILGNKTRSFIVLGVIVALIAGLVVVRKFKLIKGFPKKGGKF